MTWPTSWPKGTHGPRAANYIQECKIRTGVSHKVADALAPPLPALHTVPRAPKEKPRRLPSGHPQHEWVWHPTRWQCLTCGRGARHKTQTLLRTPCVGVPAFAEASPTHRIYRGFAGNLPLVVCCECGACTTARK
jgi:hypothetical protein